MNKSILIHVEKNKLINNISFLSNVKKYATRPKDITKHLIDPFSYYLLQRHAKYPKNKIHRQDRKITEKNFFFWLHRKQ